MSAQSKHSPSVGALAVCDDAIDLLREHGKELLPAYLIPSLPFAVAGLVFIEAVSSRNTAMLPMVCITLVITGYMRWLGGAAVQRRTAAIRFGHELPAWREMVRSYLWLRFLLQPMLAGPLAIDPLTRSSPWASCSKIRSANRAFFFRFFIATSIFYVVAILQIVVFQYFMLEIILPEVLGLDSQVFRAVLGSRFWVMSLFVILFLATEFFELIAGVLIYEALASRWSGSDLIGRVNRHIAEG